MDDNAFALIILVGGATLIIQQALDNYGYERALNDLKILLIVIVVFVTIVVVIILLIKKLISKAKYAKCIKQYKRTTPKPLEEETPEEKPKKEPTQIEKISIKQPIEEPEEEVEEIEDINITIDPDKRFFWHKKYDKHTIQFLLNRKYIIRTRYNPFTRRKERFIFQPLPPEGETHAFYVLLIRHHIQNKVSNIQMYQTVKPDIIFEIGNKKCAIEVETGKILMHNRKQLKDKIELLKKNYDHWIFVVTNKNLVAKYRKYGKVIDTRYLKPQLKKFLENTAKQPSDNSSLRRAKD